ncbi:hypothetical protein E2320_010576 [Naja naja]|nr:hypothetical protein E2320_010576 [Naja naja]
MCSTGSYHEVWKFGNLEGQSTPPQTTSIMKTTNGKTTPDFSLTPSRTTPFSPASTFEAKPGSPTNETVLPPVSQAVNFTETSLTKESVAFTTTSASLTISDDGHTFFTPTTGTATSISSALPNTTSIDTQKLCDTIQHSENFTKDRHAANLAFHGSLDLLNVTCNSCDWKKETNTLSHLTECQTYNITAKFSKDCKKSFSINVPISDNKQLNATSTNTTITLFWDTDDNCELKYSYCCFQKGNESSRISYDLCKSQPLFEVLKPNTNYKCNSTFKASRFLKTPVTRTLEITTDYGIPDQPKSCLPNSTKENITVAWSAPQNLRNGPIHGYNIQINATISDSKVPQPMRENNNMQYTWIGLQPYTMYTVKVWAYTKKKNNELLEGDPCTYSIRTLPTQPSPLKKLELSISSDGNNVVEVSCAGPDKLNGPHFLYTLTWDSGDKQNYSSCKFKVDNLSFLKTYNFEVSYGICFQWTLFSEKISGKITTKYDTKAVIGFLAFLIIVTVLALLLVLYKIYILNRKNSRDEEEGVRLVTRDDERHMKNIDPIPAELLWEAYKRKIADEGRLFLDEFQSIPRVFGKYPIREARKPYNQNKNRYIDILPYDYNRVELNTSPGEQGYDYINASYIDVSPKEETIDDFWRMIWEQKATIVVMVTRCEEGSKRRDKSAGRDVTHIQFTSWPDHGVPDDPHLLLKLRRRVNTLSNFFSGPIVVHCSAGVGRTGTYIGIDAMLEALEAEGRVDVYGYIAKLRRQRCLMVQVERLPLYKNWQNQKAGKKEENRQKNRSATVIP